MSTLVGVFGRPRIDHGVPTYTLLLQWTASLHTDICLRVVAVRTVGLKQLALNELKRDLTLKLEL